MKGVKLAQKIYSEFQTNNVFEIAQRSDISITYETWFPVTLGEFDRKAMRITVNKNAQIPFEKIIAHELGHYFAQDLTVIDEERFCDDFADELLK